MSEISRRKLITTGLAATAGASGLAAAAKLAQRYGLIPPDARRPLRPGRNADLCGAADTDSPLPGARVCIPARFRNLRSPTKSLPWATSSSAFRRERLRTGAWRWMAWSLARHRSRSAELKSFPWRSQITHLACEEGWSYIAEWSGRASLAHPEPRGRSPPGPIRCLPFVPTRLVGQHRHGRCLAPANSPRRTA